MSEVLCRLNQAALVWCSWKKETDDAIAAPVDGPEKD